VGLIAVKIHDLGFLFLCRFKS